jgi:hypothetical protein
LQLIATPSPGTYENSEDQGADLTLAIDINHNRDGPESQRKGFYGPLSNQSMPDIKPPPKIDVIGMERVYLSISLDAIQPQNSLLSSFMRHGGSVSSEDPLFESGSSFRATADDDDDMLLDGCDGFWTDPRSLCADYESRIVDKSVLLELLDAAVRLAICEQPRKCAPSIYIKRCNLKSRLACIAPVLWSPKYLQVSSQAAAGDWWHAQIDVGCRPERSFYELHTELDEAWWQPPSSRLNATVHV